jgi:hypothetical protein
VRREWLPFRSSGIIPVCSTAKFFASCLVVCVSLFSVFSASFGIWFWRKEKNCDPIHYLHIYLWHMWRPSTSHLFYLHVYLLFVSDSSFSIFKLVYFHCTCTLTSNNYSTLYALKRLVTSTVVVFYLQASTARSHNWSILVLYGLIKGNIHFRMSWKCYVKYK